MLEKYLIEHCSPTLASLKTANLFTYSYDTAERLWEAIGKWNKELQGKGVWLTALRLRGRAALVYVCRLSFLKRDLQNPGVAYFLRRYGYESTEPKDALLRLRSRLAGQGAFPHEIGLFLGYPLGAVIGFIQNEGRNFKCSGCWKVYCDECGAAEIFAGYKKCRELYIRLWNQGKSVQQLTVAM